MQYCKSNHISIKNKFFKINKYIFLQPLKKRAKDLTDISPKKTYRWLINIWRDAQHHSLLEKYKSKLQWYHLTPDRMAIIKKSTNKCWRMYGEKGTLLHCWWECKLIQPLWKTVWRFLKKRGIKPPHDPAIPLVSIYPEETKKKRHMHPSVHCSNY